MDSGACANASPPDIFGGKSTGAPTKSTSVAADSSPIEELGQRSINAMLGEGTKIKTIFDIAKITRPLLSVNQITKTGHSVVFGKHESYIQLAGTRHRIQLRAEGKL